MTGLLAHYSSLFLAPNFGILFIIIVLKYIPKYYQNPLPRHLIYFVSQSFYIRTSSVIRLRLRINDTQWRHLSTQFYQCPFLNKNWVFECCKMQVGVSRYCKLCNGFLAKPWREFRG